MGGLTRITKNLSQCSRSAGPEYEVLVLNNETARAVPHLTVDHHNNYVLVSP